MVSIVSTPICGWICGQTADLSGTVGRIFGAELHLCLQRGQQTFFRQFLMVYSRFCSVPFAFQHSLKTVFPCTPHLSVAVNVVRHRCSTYSGLAWPQSKKVVKVKLVCLKRLQSKGNLRRWIAPLSPIRRKFLIPAARGHCVGRLIFTSVFLCFRLQFPLDFGLVFRYCVGCKSHTNAENRRECMTNMKKTQRRRTDGSHPRNCPHHPRHSNSSASRIHPHKQL